MCCYASLARPSEPFGRSSAHGKRAPRRERRAADHFDADVVALLRLLEKDVRIVGFDVGGYPEQVVHFLRAAGRRGQGKEGSL